MDWDDPMLRDLAQLGPAPVPGVARDRPAPLNPVAVIRALRAQRDQPEAPEALRQSPTRRARRSSRSNSPGTLGQFEDLDLGFLWLKFHFLAGFHWENEEINR